MTEPLPGSVPNLALQRLRQAAALSQHEVAERLNALLASTTGTEGAVTANTISRWERGIVTPQHHYRRLLAELFAVTVDELGFATVQPSVPRPPAEPTDDDGC